jgi:uridine kinase
LYKVDLSLNAQHIKTMSFNKPLTVDAIVKSDGVSQNDIVAYKINTEYIRSDTVIGADSHLDCISFSSMEGHLIYQDTVIFILMKAFYRLYPQKKLVIEHSIGDGVFCEIFEELIVTADDVKALKKEMQDIIVAKIPIIRKEVTTMEAHEIFTNLQREDVVKNLKLGKMEIYQCGRFHDYYLRQLAENTSFVSSFDLIYHSPGLILRFPRMGNRSIKDKYIMPKMIFEAHQEHDKWLNILNVHNISALNRAIRNYEIVNLIQIEEALHEKKIVDIAARISWNKDAKIILIAGPSSSGKTSFAKRLSIQLKVNGVNPFIVNLDDYFLPRQFTPKKENGEFDFESISAINLELLNEHLNLMLAGEEVELPKYNFRKGTTVESHRKLKLGEKDILIMEGIHGLNDALTASVPYNHKIKIYVSALNNLNIDSHNRIRTSDSRRIRRIVRDNNFRGNSAEKTLMMWQSVRIGENKNIFPFQENADFMFNSILTYELGVLKKYIVPHLQKISKFSPVYTEAKMLLKLFTNVENIEDHFVPSNSILREFIGSSIFKY